MTLPRLIARATLLVLALPVSQGVEGQATHEYPTESSDLLRIGAGWDFHLGALTATPSAYYDVVKGHRALVYGVALGRGF